MRWLFRANIAPASLQTTLVIVLNLRAAPALASASLNLTADAVVYQDPLRGDKHARALIGPDNIVEAIAWRLESVFPRFLDRQ